MLHLKNVEKSKQYGHQNTDVLAIHPREEKKNKNKNTLLPEFVSFRVENIVK